MSLIKPHVLLSSCPNNSFEVNKSLVVTKLLSGRYPSDYLCRKWCKTNPDGYCLLCPGKDVIGDISHLLVTCDALSNKREIVLTMWNNYTIDNRHLNNLVSNLFRSTCTEIVQFLLDPTTVPSVICNKMFKISYILNLT